MPKLNNIELANFVEKLVGCRYWYGGCLYPATESLRARKAKQYPSHYTDARLAQYKKDIANKSVVTDCIGMIKGSFWVTDTQDVLDSIGTGSAIPNKYGANSCPDRSANGMFSYAKSKGMEWGTIDTLPEILGVAVHSDGHVGVYVGNGYAVEARGFNYGVVKTKVASRKWTHWYRLPFADYGDAFGDAGVSSGSTSSGSTSNTTTQPTTVALGSRLLKKGMKGADVKALQELLLQLGYELPKYGADGDFGSETERAVLAFQKDAELEEDGKYGDKTHAAFMDAVADDEDGNDEQDTPAEENPAPDGGTDDEADAPQTEPETPDAPAEEKEDNSTSVDTTTGKTVVIVSDGGKVNIRQGNGTNYGRISQVAPGSTFVWVATAQNGWHAIECCGKVGWVSGQFSRRI